MNFAKECSNSFGVLITPYSPSLSIFRNFSISVVYEQTNRYNRRANKQFGSGNRFDVGKKWKIKSNWNFMWKQMRVQLNETQLSLFCFRWYIYLRLCSIYSRWHLTATFRQHQKVRHFGQIEHVTNARNRSSIVYTTDVFYYFPP